MGLPHGAANVLAAALLSSACGTPAPAGPALVTPTESAKSAASTPTRAALPPPTIAIATLPPAPHTFTEGFETGAPYWVFLQAGVADQPLDWAANTGALRVDLAGVDQWGFAVYDPYTYADIRVDAVVEFSSGAEASAGVICRYDPVAGWYEFNIHPDRTYALLFGQWLAEGIARYTPLMVDQSEHILPGSNEIGLVCDADILTPYINGTQMRKRQEKLHVLTDGKVGLSAASFENRGVTFSYEWVSVGSP